MSEHKGSLGFKIRIFVTPEDLAQIMERLEEVRRSPERRNKRAYTWYCPDGNEVDFILNVNPGRISQEALEKER